MSLPRTSRAGLALGVVLGVVGGMRAVSSCGGDSGGAPGQDATTDGDASPQADSPTPTCDADLLTDPHHCGSCTTSCSAGQLCDDGGCMNACTAPMVQCTGVMGCVDLRNDLNHCGDCNRKCTAPEGGIPVPDGGGAGDASDAGDAGDDAGPVDDGQRIAMAACDMGKCDFTCPQAPNVAKCVNDASPSGCFDTTISTANCGTCGNACSGACQHGVCCDPPSQVCSGICTDVTMDPNNCGACGNLCNLAGQSCKANDAGVPTCVCPTGEVACPGTCADLTTDPKNCAKCGNACHNGQVCAAYACGGYTVTSPSPQVFLDACALGGTTVLPSSGFGVTAALPLPFTFQYWGSPATEFWINVQGTVGLDAFPIANFFPGYNGLCPNAIPDQSKFMREASLGLFGDTSLQTSAKGVCYATQGSQFIVTWEDALIPADNASDLTFSAILTQTTNTIDFIYEKMNGSPSGESQGAFAIIGIEAWGGSGGITQWCNQQFANTVPQSVRFTPVP